MQEFLSNSVRRLDIFKTILGLTMLFGSGYIWIRYFLDQKKGLSIFLYDHLGYFVLFGIMITLFVYGLYFFIIEITEMEENYDLEKIILQVKAIESMQKVERVNLKKLGLSKKASSKIKKYIKKKYEDLMTGFE